jgi:hypothetical protein
MFSFFHGLFQPEVLSAFGLKDEALRRVSVSILLRNLRTLVCQGEEWKGSRHFLFDRSYVLFP